jgi:hypothetical protein
MTGYLEQKIKLIHFIFRGVRSKIIHSKPLKLYPKDKELLKEVMIENKNKSLKWQRN